MKRSVVRSNRDGPPRRAVGKLGRSADAFVREDDFKRQFLASHAFDPAKLRTLNVAECRVLLTCLADALWVEHGKRCDAEMWMDALAFAGIDTENEQLAIQLATYPLAHRLQQFDRQTRGLRKRQIPQRHIAFIKTELAKPYQGKFGARQKAIAQDAGVSLSTVQKLSPKRPRGRPKNKL